MASAFFRLPKPVASSMLTRCKRTLGIRTAEKKPLILLRTNDLLEQYPDENCKRSANTVSKIKEWATKGADVGLRGESNASLHADVRHLSFYENEDVEKHLRRPIVFGSHSITKQSWITKCKDFLCFRPSRFGGLIDRELNLVDAFLDKHINGSSKTYDSLVKEDSKKKPLILLDVDGVINSLGRSKWPDLKVAMVDGYKITYSPTVVKKINEWTTKADVVWATTWEETARDHLAPELGLGPMPVLPCFKKELRDERFHEYVGSLDRPVVWIDDDGFMVWTAESNFAKCSNTLIVQPDEYIGLDQAHLDTVDEFLSKSSSIVW